LGETQFLTAIVVIPVDDIYNTIEWYERVLRFETTYVHGRGRRGETEDFANYAIMVRDAVMVHFILDEGGAVWTRSGSGYLYLKVNGVDTVYSDVMANGATITRGLEHENWPARGFNLKDPSGNARSVKSLPREEGMTSEENKKLVLDHYETFVYRQDAEAVRKRILEAMIALPPLQNQ
jgi:uncharacterized glyoxalase superfamily protein PhnB